MPYPELLECHEVLHFTHSMYSCPHQYLNSCLPVSFIESLHIYKYIVQKSDFKNFKEEKHLLEEGMVQKENINPLYEIQ